MEIPSIFPYQIKDRNLFYQRDHDKVPLLYHNDYWDDQIKKAIIGAWIKDGDTWVFMMPKLYWYINFGVITLTTKEGRMPGPPNLTDREWIIMTYILCCLGFSGFDGDEFFTCHHLVEKVENGIVLDRVENQELDETKSIYDKHGKLKKFIDPWEYLTRHYLLKEPQGIPLGEICYDNPMSDGFIFGTRNTGKTYIISVGYLAHEFFTGGIKRWEDMPKINDSRMLFGVGGPKKTTVTNFIDVFRYFHKNMPGGINREGMFRQPDLYRKITGTDPLKHEYRGPHDEVLGSLSKINLGVYELGALDLFVGDRYTGIIEDEVGLNPHVETSFLAEKNSTYDKVLGKKIGINLKAGTSGFIDFVEGSKNIFYGPKKWGVFGIPNYWEKPSQKIGLFLPSYYVNEKYKDKNGNTFIKESYDKLEADLVEMETNGATGPQIREWMQNNPNWPSEMFMSSNASPLPSDLMRMRRIQLDQSGELQYSRVIGKLVRVSKNTVRFEKDPRGIVIDHYTSQNSKLEKDTCASVYEMPIVTAEPGLYKMTYDPVRSDGKGKTDDASFCAIVVYKGFDMSKEGIQNNIVFTWLFRTDSLDGNHDIAMMVSDFYNGCQILHEDDVGGFTGYARRKGKIHRLAATPQMVNNIKISGNALSKVGINTGSNSQLKMVGLRLYSDWLLEELPGKEREEEDEQKFTNLDGIMDMRILDEGAQYDIEGNYDITTCMCILCIWLKTENTKVYKSEVTEKTTDTMRELYRIAMERSGQIPKLRTHEANWRYRTS